MAKPTAKAQAQGLRKGARQAAGRALPPAGLGEGLRRAHHHRARGPRRRRQGRADQGDDRTREPARLSRRRPAGAVGPREDADVHAALHGALSRRRRDRDLRPQLVQPRRRRACHGLLHARAAPALPRALPGRGEVHHRGRHPADQDLARGRPGGAGTALHGAHRRSDPAVEAEPDGCRILQALVRFLAGARSHAATTPTPTTRRGTSCARTTSAGRD